MLRHFKTFIDYQKLIEIQANKPYVLDKIQSKANKSKKKVKRLKKHK